MNKIFRFINKRILRLFWSLHINLLKKNNKFKDIETNKTCIIIGNGSSLKYYNYDAFNNYTCISTSYLLYDNRAKKLNIKYYVIPDSYITYPFLINSYDHSVQWNYIAPLLKGLVYKFKKTFFFTRLENRYGFLRVPKNLHFVFDEKSNIPNQYDLSGSFNTFKGSLDFMLGLAKYLGFKKVYLAGCDYLGSPAVNGHFYSYTDPNVVNEDLFVDYKKRINKLIVDLNLDVELILPKGQQSKLFKYKNFETFFKYKESNLKNEDIVENNILNIMKKGHKKRQIFLWTN